MATAVYGKGIMGLLKRGWNEIPDVMFGSCMALIGIGMGVGSLYVYYKKGGEDTQIHKLQYIVVRPDDPRAEIAQKYRNLRKD